MSRALTFLLPLALAGCTIYDHGFPLRTECSNPKVSMVVVRIESPDRIRAMYGDDARAFQGENSEGVPIIVVPPLRGQRDTLSLEAWGHELAHVVCGNWHK